ncbi:glycosyltransferase family 4 protein [Brevundimonas sp.]|jgi:glycosyltransferase involved in cell wall biosynthesis|uniref:glycosyltransferase family 4 protein n=1 Tax=Brevundimonas sp. TaxID=1871086 RepID=UPI0037C1498A
MQSFTPPSSVRTSPSRERGATTICIDGFNLALAKGSGIATYGRNLIASLNDMGCDTQVLYAPLAPLKADPLLDEIALVDQHRPGKPPTKAERFVRTRMARFGLEAHHIPHSEKVIWPADGALPPGAKSYWASRDLYRTAQRVFRRSGRLTEVRFARSDAAMSPIAMHWTAPLPLRARGVLNLHTLHDLIPLRLPFATTEDKSRYLALCRRIVASADHLIVVSETTRRDVIELLNVSEDKVTNTYQAARLPPGHADRSDTEVAAELEAAFGLEWRSYFLHYGVVEPKKNLGRLVEAYIISGVRSPLVIVGAKGWLDGDETALLRHVQEHGAAGQRIMRFDYLPAGVLASLVRGARATLFPSLYEGFGLPVLESMMMGTPVLTSDAGSLPEIAGGFARLVDPLVPASIAAGISDLDGDPGLRKALTEGGQKHAEAFSPAAYQQRLEALYERLGISG